MAQQVELEVAPRTVVGKATKHLRRAGFIPANISGHKQPSVAVQIDATAFERVRREHGLKNILTLKQSNTGNETALVRHVERDAVSGKIVHVDFVRVSLSERIETHIPLHFVGEAPGVRLHGGILLHLLDSLSVECRAADIVEHLEVDISPLTEIGAVLHAHNVKLPEGYTLLTDAEEPIVKVDAPRVEPVEPAATEAAPAAPAPETSEKAGA